MWDPSYHFVRYKSSHMNSFPYIHFIKVAYEELLFVTPLHYKMSISVRARRNNFFTSLRTDVIKTSLKYDSIINIKTTKMEFSATLFFNISSSINAFYQGKQIVNETIAPQTSVYILWGCFDWMTHPDILQTHGLNLINPVSRKQLKVTDTNKPC